MTCKEEIKEYLDKTLSYAEWIIKIGGNSPDYRNVYVLLHEYRQMMLAMANMVDEYEMKCRLLDPCSYDLGYNDAERDFSGEIRKTLGLR